MLLENKITSLFLDEDEQIDVFEETWAELAALAFGITESAEFLRSSA